MKSVASGLVHAYTSVTSVVASVKALVASSAEDLKDTLRFVALILPLKTPRVQPERVRTPRVTLGGLR